MWLNEVFVFPNDLIEIEIIYIEKMDSSDDEDFVDERDEEDEEERQHINLLYVVRTFPDNFP